MTTPTGWDLYTQRVTYLGTTPKEQLLNTLQQKVNQDFDDSSTVQDIIHYKYNSITNTYVSTPCHCRVTSVRMATKGTYKKIKDDMKDIIFQDLNYSVRLGDIFEFSGFRWIVVETDNIMSATQDCIVQRMNVKINFYDNKGILHKLDGYASNSIANFLEKELIILPKDQLYLIMRYDSESKLIQYAPIAQRFIINGNPWRVNSAIDNTSYIRNGEGYIEIRLVYDATAEYDDVDKDIADYWKYNAKHNYTFSISNKVASIKQGSTYQINTNDLDGTNIYTPNITYTSSDTNICTVDNNGLINGVNIGTSIITVTDSISGLSDSFSLEIQAIQHTFTINNKVSMLNVGNNYTLNCTATDDGVTNPLPTILYSSSNNAIATVDVNGNINVISVGNVTIIASYNGIVDTMAFDSIIADNYTATITSSNGKNTCNVGSTLTYTSQLYNNSIAINGNFTFSLDYHSLATSVATLTIVDSTHCKVKCNNYGSNWYVTLNAIDSVTGATCSFDIYLKSVLG